MSWGDLSSSYRVVCGLTTVTSSNGISLVINWAELIAISIYELTTVLEVVTQSHRAKLIANYCIYIERASRATSELD